MSKVELDSPLRYSMELFLNGKKEEYSLDFQTACTKWNRYGGMDGYTYSFNGRTYRDVDSLWQELEEQLAENVSIGVDQYGEKVLKTSERIPTFDSCDGEWNSRFMRFLFYDGKQINLVTMAGGYRIAQLTFCENLLSANIRIQPILEKLGWPTDSVVWT